MMLNLKLVEKRESRLAKFNTSNSVLILLFLWVPISVFCLIMTSGLLQSTIGVLMLIVVIASAVISRNRFRILGNSYYYTTGQILLTAKEISYGDTNIELSSQTKVEINYSGIQNGGFGSKDVSDGISDIRINGTRMSVLLENRSQEIKLKNIFKLWYENGVSLDEVNKVSGLRLIALNPNWEWEDLKKINRA